MIICLINFNNNLFFNNVTIEKEMSRFLELKIEKELEEDQKIQETHR